MSVAGAGTTIGGTTAGAGNLISGNSDGGILLGGGSLVVGNTIGTDITGTIAIGNGLAGVEIYESSDNTIGGTTAAARNLISGNSDYGVEITGIAQRGISFLATTSAPISPAASHLATASGSE